MRDTSKFGLLSPMSVADMSRCMICSAKSYNACGALDQASLPRLAALAHLKTFKAGETLFYEGAAANTVYQLTSGQVRLTRDLRNGRRQIVGFKFEGDMIDQADGDHYSCSAEAISDVKACRFERNQFTALGAENPELARRLLQISSVELAEMQEHISALAQPAATNRLAAFLLLISHAAARHRRPDNPIELPMRRADIADFLGMAVETVSRSFTRLKDLGLINIEGTQLIRILDFAKLRDYDDKE